MGTEGKKKEFNPIWFVRREKMNLFNEESGPNDNEGRSSSQIDCPEVKKGDGHPSSSTVVTNNNNNDDEMEIIFASARTVKPLDDNLMIAKPKPVVASDSNLKEDEYCSNCFKLFLKVDRLVAHRKICHLQLNRPTSFPKIRIPVVEKFLCKLCGRSFRQKIGLCTHLQRHMDKKLAVCHCNKAFTNRQHLQEHMQRHNNPQFNKNPNTAVVRKLSSFRLGYKHYFCYKKKSSKAVQLKRRFLHATFSCPVCAKKFKQKQKNEFRNHMKSHVNRPRHRDTSIICKLCGMLFSEKRGLIHHLQNHSFTNHHQVIGL